ncbi:MAG: hypothetical protein Ta2B_00490 [Termitinemataceae bacterium]|nr:MAG: hypothetical protein Ta2B_00490 [Termitinemataceae bacterium]
MQGLDASELWVRYLAQPLIFCHNLAMINSNPENTTGARGNPHIFFVIYYPIKLKDPDGRLSTDEETANAAKNIGENDPKPKTSKQKENIEKYLKENGWEIITPDEQNAINEDVKDKADQENKDWSVSSISESSRVDETVPITETDATLNAFRDQIRRRGGIPSGPNIEPQPKITTYAGRVFAARARDSTTGSTTAIIRRYIDIDNDGYIDGRK